METFSHCNATHDYQYQNTNMWKGSQHYRTNGVIECIVKCWCLQPIYQVSISPTDGNGPTQGQRKTLTRVGIEPTTFGFDHCCSTNWATRSDGSRSWEMKMLMARQWICRYKEGLRCTSNVWPCSTYMKNEWSDRMYSKVLMFTTHIPCEH